MKEFKMYTDIVYADSFQMFVQSEELDESDLILTSELLYHTYVEPLNLSCQVLLIRAYGKGEPTTEMVDHIRKDIPRGTKRLIAIGGGSTMDIAKMLSLVTPSGKSEDLFLGSDAITRIYSVYAVPTTCGTGSEVTNACAAELTSLHTKRGFSSMLMFPEKAILIPALVSDLPYQFFATSSIDALIHAAESFLSPDASPVSELFSREAIRLILNGYQQIVKIGPDQWTKWASDFLNASNFAGLAFSSAGCAAVHALSYPLGGGYHIPHGEANQLVFAATFRKYKEKQPEGKLQELEALWGELLHVSEDEALNTVFALFDRIQPRRQLRTYGISENELRSFAESVMVGQTRLLNHSYIPLNLDDMLEIYQAIY